MSGKVTYYDGAQQKRNDELERMVEISEEEQATPKNAPKKNKSRKTKACRSGSGSNGGMSSRGVSKPRVARGREVQSVTSV